MDQKLELDIAEMYRRVYALMSNIVQKDKINKLINSFENETERLAALEGFQSGTITQMGFIWVEDFPGLEKGL